MSKAPPPLLGFNNNVRHRGRIFHIQTEDSGVKFPRIVTHLFADGGRIVKTTRTDYSEHLERPDMAPVVRGMMKEQHKGMFAALRTGELDVLLEQVCGPLDAAKAKAPESVRDPTATSDLETARVIVGRAAPAASVPAPQQASAPEAPAPEASPPQALAPQAPASRAISNPNLRRPTPSVMPPRADAFDLDVGSLDRIPPKPSVAAPPAPPARKSSPAARKSRPPIPTRPSAGAPAAAAGARTAAVEASPASLGRPQTRLAAAPPSSARSIFGDGAISEQSLDEVILSYLAEDLEETK